MQFTKKKATRTNKFSKVEGHKKYFKNQLYFYIPTMNNKKFKLKIKYKLK